MIKKFFLQIVLISLIVCFFGLNFDTKVSIKFWFNDLFTLHDISLFIALAVSYILGVITIVPMFISRNIKIKKNKKEEKLQDINE